MSDNPTSAQYALGVTIGHAVVAAMKDGASYDEVISTLRHSIGLTERNKAFGIDLAALPSPTPTAWLGWNSGDCPIPEASGEEFSVRLRDGEEISVPDLDAMHLRWRHDGGDQDIVAYRLNRAPKHLLQGGE